MKNSILLKYALSILIASFCLYSRNVSIFADEEKPAFPKTPTVEKKQQTIGEDLPEISLENTEHDAGKVYEGTLVKHDFIVKNKGKSDLIIKGVKPG